MIFKYPKKLSVLMNEGFTPIQLSHIPLDHEIILRAKSLIPPEFHEFTWIAGSAATRYPQNKDVDLWVVNVTRGIAPDRLIPGSIKMGVSATEEDYDHICHKAIDNDGLQIMVSHDGIFDILDHFDISCHAAAINIVTGEVIRSAHYSDSLKIINWSNATKTLARYFRFAERYQDWRGLHEPKTITCAGEVFGLMSRDDMHREMQYLRWIEGYSG